MLALVLGHMGSGKTLFLTILGALSKKRVIANYKLNYPNKKVENMSVAQIANMEYESGVIILLDEAWLYIDARRSSSSLNTIFSYILFQSRKKGLDFYLSAQIGNSLDIRFRKLADFIISCENKKYYFLYTILKTSTRQFKKIYLPFESAERFFKYYDTNETIINDRSRVCMIRAMSTKEKKKLINELSEKFMEEYHGSKITKYIIKNFLFEHNIQYDSELVDILHAKLKSMNI